MSSGIIHVSLMCIHAYYIRWDVGNGWKKFIERRTAVKKIESLQEATSNQLAELEDVCAICYNNMELAKVTKCNQYFHGVCLLKWIYVRVTNYFPNDKLLLK